MKHSSNITKLVLTCVSIMVSTLMSMALFDLQITLYFVISLSFILIGLPLYMLGILGCWQVTARCLSGASGIFSSYSLWCLPLYDVIQPTWCEAMNRLSGV
ncbi:hypothetical protein EB796_010334 [Bugula neritina]|uniref:Uncharacterized protein n=1 Tax=Bugula neritina TaxID=10212 RepID=A0A7J7K193_BUGNE|nr:hypothetical protein EB796_010334 [Bugula neritina]